MADIEAMFELDNQPTLNAEFDVEQVENIDVHFDVATGTSYHNQLLNRDLPNQHPITSITGLREELDSIKETANTNTEELTNLINQEQERAEQAEADLESDIQSKYTELFTAINEETYRATTKENILNGEITDTNAHIDSVENELTQDINTEKAERRSADNYLQEQINQNADNFSNYNTKSEQYSIDNQQNIAINNEITNRENADRELQYQITVNLNKFANYRTSSAQDAIDSDIRSSIATEQNARELADLDLQNQITEEVERSSSSETNLQNQITSNTNNINTIKSYIPSQTSSTNQLADKNFVNSSISSNTAIFIGTFDSVEDLESYSGTLTVNDYAFVIAIDSDGNTVYNRYKWTGTQWLYEYSLNNSSFTAAQWAAINSTITEDLVNEYSLHVNNKSNPHNVTKSQIGLGNVDNTSDLNKPISTATQSALNNKQNVISDLQNIRDGASLGATSLQENSQIIIDMQNDINSNMGDIASINADISNLVTINTEQEISGGKKFTQPLTIQNGEGTGSLWIGGNVNSGNLSNKNRHIARISAPSYNDITKATTMLGFDSSGDNTLSVANNTYDTLSFGGQKKITNATSPMAIGFCVTKTRESTAATDKIIPLEMDANEVRFNVQPNYNGTDLATATDISSLQTSKQDKLTAGTGISISNNVISNTQTSAEWGNIQGTLSNQTDLQNALNNKVSKTGDEDIDGIKTFKQGIVGTFQNYYAYNPADATKPYCKVMEITLTNSYQTVTIPFIMTASTPGSRGSVLGQIKLRVEGTSGVINTSATGVNFSFLPDWALNNYDFKILYKNNYPNSNQALVEFWVKVKNAYNGVCFTILDEMVGGTYKLDRKTITWYNNTQKYAELPSDYSVINFMYEALYAATPSLNSNNKQISTTEWVRSNMPTITYWE